MEEAAVVSWRKQLGERVEKDEILFEMETDKVIVEVPSPAAGWVLRIDVREGAAKVEQVVAWIGDQGEQIPEPQHAAPAEGQRAAATPSPAASGPSREIACSPAARRLARELGISLDSIQGTGPGGRITEADIRKAGSRA